MTQRIAVVTGASSGFGRLTAEQLAAAGWRVYATMRDAASRNAAAAGELRAAGIAVVELDVLDDASVDRAAATILAEAGAPDLLVNNAGNGFFGPQEAFTPAAVERQFATNVFGPLRVDRAFLPAMRERGSGLVVFVSSIVGRLVIPYSSVYAASKWALEAFAESLSYELAPFGVDVSIVQPGAYPTDIGSKTTTPDDQARMAAYSGALPYLTGMREGLAAAASGRDSGDVARAIVSLAALPGGTRPLRVTVPPEPGTEAINATAAGVQRETLQTFGMGDLLPKTPVA